MATEILIVGASGSGKSSSIESLDPTKTFIINVGKKNLPFKGWRGAYKTLSKDNPTGNYHCTDIMAEVVDTLKYIDSRRKEINTIIIDDSQYLMANEYMRRANENGFKKFTDISQNMWNIISTVKSMRDDLSVVFMSHSEVDYDSNGNKITKAKTVGKMFDAYVTLEGMFTIVLYTNVEKKDDQMIYSFTTQTDGTNTAKSPKGMFETYKIPNDLSFVIRKIKEYEGIDVLL